MKRYALIVMNNEFNAPKLTQLAVPGSDVKSLVEVLEDEALGGFEVTTCFNRSYTVVLEEIEGLYRRKQQDDLLLLYYAGHGIKDDFGDLFYSCRNTKMHRFRSSAVSAAFIRSELEKCRSQRKVVILDCWYCGIFDEINPRQALEGPADTLEAFNARGDGRVILTASDIVRYVWDADKLRGSAEPSVFTQYIVEGLTAGAAARENRAEISLDDLYAYVREHITATGQFREIPQKWGGRVNGPIIMARTPASQGRIPSEPSKIDLQPAETIQTAGKELHQAIQVREVEKTSPIVQQLQDSLLTPSYSNDIGIDFVLIKPGQFDMGSDEGDANEQPVHHVTIPTPFYMGKYQVTQANWEAVVGSNPSRFRGADLPVETVSWDDVHEFLRRLNDLEGAEKNRLPTEEEWEYACRAGTTTPFAFGETMTTNQANYNGNHPYGDAPKGEYRKQTIPVGSFPPNAWGLHDMHGNVWEWTSSCYRIYTKEPVDKPEELSTSFPRIIRGGSWRNSAKSCRSAKRFNITPVYRNSTLGFRLVKLME